MNLVSAARSGTHANYYRVPCELRPYIRKDTKLIVETNNGLDIATAITEVIPHLESDDIVNALTSSYKIRTVVGILTKVVEDYYRNKIANEILSDDI